MASNNTPKTMSSRLLTMKFMQRASAAGSPSSPTTTRSEDDPSPKRRKFAQSPSERGPLVDAVAVKAAIDEEERKRQAAIAKQAEELGDTRWILDLPKAPSSKSGVAPKTPLKIVQIGFAQVDSEDASSQQSGGVIRRFNMKKGKKQQAKSGKDEETESDRDSAGSDSDDSSPDTPEHAAAAATGARGRSLEASGGKRKRAQSETSSRRNAERIKAQEFSAKRRKKEVKLNRSASSGGISANSFRARGGSRGGRGGFR